MNRQRLREKSDTREKEGDNKMKQYIVADLKRIVGRVPYWICMLLLIGYMMALFLIQSLSNWNAVIYLVTASAFAGMLPIFLGLLVFIAVFSVDFKTKTMQVAIGTGLSRAEVVLSKAVEVFVITIAGIVLIGVVVLLAGVVTGAGMNATHAMEIINSLWMKGVAIISYNYIAMILIFFTQKPGVGTMCYIALATPVVEILVSVINDIKLIKELDIRRFYLASLIDTAHTRLILGTFDIASFIGIAAYIMAGVAVTILLFRKRELEF